MCADIQSISYLLQLTNRLQRSRARLDQKNVRHSSTGYWWQISRLCSLESRSLTPRIQLSLCRNGWPIALKDGICCVCASEPLDISPRPSTLSLRKAKLRPRNGIISGLWGRFFNVDLLGISRQPHSPTGAGPTPLPHFKLSSSSWLLSQTTLGSALWKV